MGGIKNRDEKRKAAKVFSSGGGGGAKGPAVLDKRGTEEKCPHCDRVFKQNNRLKEHVAKHHAELAAPEPAPSGKQASAASTSSSSSAAAAAPATRPSSASSTAAGSSTAARPPAPRAAVGAAAACAAASASGAGAGSGTFDVGSRGGYYTEKSPKLMLHEWCGQAKRPRPKYKAVPVDAARGGKGWRARVVLPDPKLPGSDRDLVVWLDAAHAAEGEEEALQRGAVAALQAVAGDRGLDYVLPQRYRQLWRDMQHQAEERAEQQRRAAAAAAERRARTTRLASSARAPVAVVMSEQQRAAVEGLMAELALSEPPQGGAVAGGAPGGEPEHDAAAASGLVDSLVRAGFSAADSAAAVRAVGTRAGADAAADAAAATAAAASGGRGMTRVLRAHDGLQPYLDWLCLSLPVERLPARYRPGGSSGTVGVLRVKNPGGGSGGGAAGCAAGSTASDDSDGEDAWQHDPAVSALVAWGYPAAHAMDALQAHSGRLLPALYSLQASLVSGAAAAPNDSDGCAFAAGDAGDGVGAGAVPAAWCDEVEVLAAIYGDELDASVPGRLSLSVDGGELAGGGGLQLLVWCPCGGRAYPDAAPLLALACDQLAGGTLLHLTAGLAREAQGLVGEAMIHELAVRLAELLEAAGDGSGLPTALPPPFDAAPGGAEGGAEGDAEGGAEGGDGYSDEAAVHAAAAEALLADAGSGGAGERGSSGRARRPRARQHAAALPPEQAAAEARRLREHFERLQVAPGHAGMRAARARLPAAACRAEVLAAVAAHAVVVISGATGCGKSTQVPQYLLEAGAAGGGPPPYVIVAQPRRIAAVGLATRVADEVGDAAGPGGLVGYSVRLDTRAGPRTRLLFCTTGVLLRRLVADPELAGVSHVVLDEVHERNLDSDLLLLLLRRALLQPRRAGGPPPPKVLLMSATAEAELFGQYFSAPGRGALLQGGPQSARSAPPRALGVALLSIPGFTHPVRQLWLEDALAATGIVVGRQSKYAKKRRAKGGGPSARGGGDDSDGDDDDGSAYEGLGELEGEGRDDSDAAVAGPQQPQRQRPQAAAAQRGRPQPGGRAPPQPQKQQQQAQRAPQPGGGRGGALAELGADAPAGVYSEEVGRSLALVDPALIHYELIEALVATLAATQRAHGPAGLLKARRAPRCTPRLLPSPLGWGRPPLAHPRAAAAARCAPRRAQGWAGAPPGAVEDAAAEGQGGALGAVLVFMPGAPEIDRLVRLLAASPRLAAAAGHGGVRVLPLHGGLPAGVQARVFERPPPGVLKVVVATNVAETSLTIDDVTVVIDTGRHKEMSYDPSRGLSRLEETWVSQAAAAQRRGRAGRVAPGSCYRLWPARMWGRLAAQQSPEVLRVPLAQLCLTAKAALDAAAEAEGAPPPALSDALSALLTPPAPDAVAEALGGLAQLGALAPDAAGGGEDLTPLGKHLAAMPMDAALGKALLHGCMLRCASPLLTIAAALGHGRPMWVNPPPDKRSEANAARRALAPQAYAQRSDHLALVAAFDGWSAARAAGGRGAGREFAQANFVSEQVLEAIAKGRLDYAATLAGRGFLPDWYVDHLRARQQGGPSRDDAAAGAPPGAASYGRAAVARGAPDEFSHNARIVKAALAAGFYPRVLRVEAPVKYTQVAGGAARVEADPGSIKLFERALGRVWVHPASVCFTAGSYSSGWLVYSQLVETSRAFAREVSMVPVWSLLAFGGELEVLHDQGLLLLDGWAKFKAPARVGVLIKHLRAAVASLLAAKVADPSLDLAGQRVVEALHALLATDGF
ncbi:DHX57 [Scenedesmus sp. PABB004]|nr:DHX57 [Scenedesmus sp. PABB004]